MGQESRSHEQVRPGHRWGYCLLAHSSEDKIMELKALTPER